MGREIAGKTFTQVWISYFAVGKGLFYLACPD